jgi:hypothetical protein
VSLSFRHLSANIAAAATNNQLETPACATPPLNERRRRKDTSSCVRLSSVRPGRNAVSLEPSLQECAVFKTAHSWHRTADPDALALGGGDLVAHALANDLALELGEGRLAPQTGSQRSEAATASQTAADLAKTAWIQAAEESEHVPHPFVLIMIVWLFVLFVSFGLFAPRNALVVIALLVGALSIAGAVVLIVDMDSPFEGMLVVSADPMQEALAKMNAP